jgi:3-oxoacyl-[acyl-carrier protein] reductase
MVEVLAKELGSRQVTVNSVVAGVTRSEGVFTTTPADDPFFEAIAERTPLGRVGTPADVAAVVSFLAGPDAAFVTGNHLQADGGIR